MTILDKTDSQTMTELLAKLFIKGEVSSLEDLKALIKPKKKSEIKKEKLSHVGYIKDEEDDTEITTTVVPKLGTTVILWFNTNSKRSCVIYSLETWSWRIDNHLLKESSNPIYLKISEITSCRGCMVPWMNSIMWRNNGGPTNLVWWCDRSPSFRIILHHTGWERISHRICLQTGIYFLLTLKIRWLRVWMGRCWHFESQFLQRTSRWQAQRDSSTKKGGAK